MSIIKKYKDTKQRLKIITEFQGIPCLEDKKKKQFEYCEEDEKIENGFIIKIPLEEIKQEKINKLKEHNKATIYAEYSQNTQIDVITGIRAGLEEMKEFINNHLQAFYTVETTINNIDDYKQLKEYNEIEEYNKIISKEDGTSIIKIN